jgi:hypothetical protein
VRLACVHLLFYWKSFFSTDHRWPSLDLNIFND